MIIKTTFKDNDFTKILENYWNKFWFKNYYKAVDKLDVNITDFDKAIDEDWEQLRKWKDAKIEAEELLDKAFFKESEMTAKDIRRFAKIIKDSIVAFIEEPKPVLVDGFSKEDINYLKKNLVVEIKSTLRDKDENGENVYYLLNNKTAIIM